MEVKFFFDEFEYLRGMKDIDLQISEHGIIIHLDNDHYIIDRNYEPIEMKFDFKIYQIKCQNLEKTINIQKLEIKKLSNELLQLNKDKEDLKVFIRNNSALKEEIKDLNI